MAVTIFHLNITIPNGWCGWGDPKRDPASRLTDFRPTQCQRGEYLQFFYPVVGGHNQKDIVRVTRKSSKINRRCGIAAGFFEYAVRFEIELLHSPTAEKPGWRDEIMTGSVELEIAVARSRVRAKRLRCRETLWCFGRDFRLDGQKCSRPS